MHGSEHVPGHQFIGHGQDVLNKQLFIGFCQTRHRAKLDVLSFGYSDKNLHELVATKLSVIVLVQVGFFEIDGVEVDTDDSRVNIFVRDFRFVHELEEVAVVDLWRFVLARDLKVDLLELLIVLFEDADDAVSLLPLFHHLVELPELHVVVPALSQDVFVVLSPILPDRELLFELELGLIHPQLFHVYTENRLTGLEDVKSVTYR